MLWRRMAAAGERRQAHYFFKQGLKMTRFRAICTAVVFVCASGHVLADAKSQAANAEQFLLMAHADKLATPVFAQVQQMFAQRFAQANGAESKKALLESYQAKANAVLEKAVGWNQVKPDLIKLYATSFTEAELKELIVFYQSPLGKKLMDKMPALSAQSAQLTQKRLESAVPEVNKLLADMTKQLEPAAAKPAAKKP
jgi:hypothetical protein